MSGEERLHVHWRARLTTLNCAENQCDGLEVVVDVGFHRRATVEPAGEFLDEPRVRPFGLVDEVNGLAFAALGVAGSVRKHFQAVVIHDKRRLIALRTEVFLTPAVETDGIGLGSFVAAAFAILHLHHGQALAVAWHNRVVLAFARDVGPAIEDDLVLVAVVPVAVEVGVLVVVDRIAFVGALVLADIVGVKQPRPAQVTAPSPGHTNRDRPLRDIVDREHVIVTGQVDVRTRISVDAFIAEVHAANAPADDQLLFDAVVVERVRLARIKRDNVKVLQLTSGGKLLAIDSDEGHGHSLSRVRYLNKKQ